MYLCTELWVLQINAIFHVTDTTGNPEARSMPIETGSSSDYSSLNMTSLNTNVVYDALQQT